MEWKGLMACKDTPFTHHLATKAVLATIYGPNPAHFAGIPLRDLAGTLQTKQLIQEFLATGQPFLDFHLQVIIVSIINPVCEKESNTY